MKRRVLTAVAAFALAFAAILGLGATPALAATTYEPIGGQTTFVKNLVVNDDANIPDITFAFTIQRGAAAAATGTTPEILSSDVTAAIGNAVFTNNDTTSTIEGMPSDTTSTTAGKKYAQKTVNVTFPLGSFTKPGVYRYIITETNGNLPGVTYDSNLIRYLDVYVQVDSNNKLFIDEANSETNTQSGYVLHTADSNEKSSGYTNILTQYDFEFTKTITGNQGDKNKRFTFTLNITGANPGTYKIETEAVTSNQYITVSGNGTLAEEFDLTDGSSIKVLGLNSGAICTVTEDAQDYTASYKIDTGEVTNGASSGNITMNADRVVAFTNTRNGVIPTGIILTVAPFAIGLMLFGALTVLFVSKSMRRAV